MMAMKELFHVIFSLGIEIEGREAKLGCDEIFARNARKEEKERKS